MQQAVKQIPLADVLSFTTKAGNLLNLSSRLRSGKILPLFVVSYKKWRSAHTSVLNDLKKEPWADKLMIVRSSSANEDGQESSSAGKYESVLDISSEDLSDAINLVFRSYGENVEESDQVLIQPMLQDVTMSGVMFTYDPNNGAPYYIINYDLKGDTSAITGGKLASHTVYISREIKKIYDGRFRKLVELGKELEQLFGNEKLDIEFAFDAEENLYLFQARPLVMKQHDEPVEHTKVLQGIQARIKQLNFTHPYLFGNRTILGVMPDWNPAEIIGLRPKPLALSLYKEIITDSTWAYQRDNYGYKSLRSFPLLIDLGGVPYIDVRVSFNSFVPKELEPTLAEKLVNYYLDRLEGSPYLHDKVEFDIVFSCYMFDLPEKMEVLKKHGFDEGEIRIIADSLKSLTNTIIHKNKGLWLQDVEKITELQKRHEAIFFNENFDELTKIYWLTEECKRYGTLPFAGLARAGFIAIQLLNSMVEIGILTLKERASFLNSLDSVSINLTRDLPNLSKDEFLKKYGHLRPGTYDILSPRYDETPDIYFDWSKISNAESHERTEFRLSLNQLKKIEQLLEQHGLDHDVVGLFTFMKAAIEGREYSKFVFTKTLSEVLSLIKTLSAQYELSIEDAAFLDIKSLNSLYSTSWDLKSELKRMIDEGRKKHQITSKLNLPPLIFKAEDVELFELPENKPNFITLKNITAPIIKDLSNSEQLKGMIVFIPSADPGFDWIFTRGISGFITAYGGVNSHMAIRAGELGLPAVIGAGEKLYNQWSQGNIIHLDCANHRVEIIH